MKMKNQGGNLTGLVLAIEAKHFARAAESDPLDSLDSAEFGLVGHVGTLALGAAVPLSTLS